MERAEDDLQTNGIYHVRGGIDRYLKTFPEGGYWKGRNYLFDLRGEQKPVRFFLFHVWAISMTSCFFTGG
jgi:hypothetical protein